MTITFFFWSTLLVAALSVTGLAIRGLAMEAIPLSETLIVRGFVSLFVVIAWAKKSNLALIPKSVKTQTIRALIAGLALTFFSLSYNWLSASTIAVISNVDVPLLVILGALVGQVSSVRAKFLSGVSILILIVYSLNIQNQPQWKWGLSTLLVGLLLLCFGYAFIKKSMSEENRAITVLTPSLAIIVYGLVQKMFESPSDLGPWNASTLLVGIISGLGMFVAYYATMKLYDVADIATAEFPTLIASLVIQPLEWLFFKEPMLLSHFALSVAFVVCTFFILNTEVTSGPANEHG